MALPSLFVYYILCYPSTHGEQPYDDIRLRLGHIGLDAPIPTCPGPILFRIKESRSRSGSNTDLRAQIQVHPFGIQEGPTSAHSKCSSTFDPDLGFRIKYKFIKGNKKPKSFVYGVHVCMFRVNKNLLERYKLYT